MVTNRRIISASITPEQEEFLLRTGCSPSKLLQEAIENRIEIYKKHTGNEIQLLKKIEILGFMVQDYSNYVELIGKYEDFQSYMKDVLAKRNNPDKSN